MDVVSSRVYTNSKRENSLFSIVIVPYLEEVGTGSTVLLVGSSVLLVGSTVLVVGSTLLLVGSTFEEEPEPDGRLKTSLNLTSTVCSDLKPWTTKLKDKASKSSWVAGTSLH
jgi:hypothetical protein